MSSISSATLSREISYYLRIKSILFQLMKSDSFLSEDIVGSVDNYGVDYEFTGYKPNVSLNRIAPLLFAGSLIVTFLSGSRGCIIFD